MWPRIFILTWSGFGVEVLVTVAVAVNVTVGLGVVVPKIRVLNFLTGFAGEPVGSGGGAATGFCIVPSSKLTNNMITRIERDKRTRNIVGGCDFC
jgi:hypothetical protein